MSVVVYQVKCQRDNVISGLKFSALHRKVKGNVSENIFDVIITRFATHDALKYAAKKKNIFQPK